jgi:hypothetical protein
MEIRYILLMCTAMLLSGCAVGSLVQPSGKSVGRTYEQLVEAKRSDQSIYFAGFTSSIAYGGIVYYCNNSCNGQPTRTYTNPAGNKVVSYLYSLVNNVPVSCNQYGNCGGGYSQCLLVEERYELKDNVVVDEWYFTGTGAVWPLYTHNVCNGYGSVNVNDTDPNRKNFDRVRMP